MRRLMRPHRLVILLGCVLALTGCADHAPPNLSPAATVAWQKTQVIRGLDILRDTAIDANATTPPVMVTATTRKVVQFHQSALLIIKDSSGGWAPLVSTSLSEVVKHLPAKERDVLAPYVSLVKALLKEVK